MCDFIFASLSKLVRERHSTAAIVDLRLVPNTGAVQRLGRTLGEDRWKISPEVDDCLFSRYGGNSCVPQSARQHE